MSSVTCAICSKTNHKQQESGQLQTGYPNEGREAQSLSTHHASQQNWLEMRRCQWKGRGGAGARQKRQAARGHLQWPPPFKAEQAMPSAMLMPYMPPSPPPGSIQWARSALQNLPPRCTLPQSLPPAVPPIAKAGLIAKSIASGEVKGDSEVLQKVFYETLKKDEIGLESAKLGNLYEKDQLVPVMQKRCEQNLLKHHVGGAMEHVVVEVGLATRENGSTFRPADLPRGPLHE